MKIAMKKKRVLKTTALLTIAVILVLSLSSCLSSCLTGGSEMLYMIMDELAASMLNGDAMSVNILISNPSKLGLENESASLPVPNLNKTDYENGIKSVQEICGALLKVNYSSLTPSQKLDYDTVMDYFYTYSNYADYYYFQDNYLGSNSGWNAVLPIYLDKYAFYDEHDINNWLGLVEQTYEAFPKYAQYEQIRIDAGYGRADFVYEAIAEQCLAMADAASTDGEHFLLTLFNDKIDACTFLNESQKSAYVARCTSAINNKLIPAYTALSQSVMSFIGNANNNGLGLSAYGEEGKSYYELLFLDSTSSSDSVNTAYQNLTSAYNSTVSNARLKMNALNEMGMTDDDIEAGLINLESNADLSAAALQGVYSTLKASYTQNFPALPSSVPDATFKEVPPAMSNYYNPASYFKSAIDSASAEETIYVNSANATGYLGFDLIAHEGIPGHMLQHAYYKTTGAHMLRSMITYLGYTEGWATYAQYYVSRYYGETETDRLLYDLIMLNDQITQIVITLMDIDVNYYGYTPEALTAKYTPYGFGEAGIANVYRYVVENPATYASYAYGNYKMNQLRQSYAGDDLAFHTAILNIGSTNFELVAKYL